MKFKQTAIEDLIRQRAWFKVVPLPDDEWSVEVKWDRAHIA